MATRLKPLKLGEAPDPAVNGIIQRVPGVTWLLLVTLLGVFLAILAPPSASDRSPGL